MGVYLRGVLHQLHPAIFQVDQAHPHPPQQLQVLWVVGHEVLGPEGGSAHPRLPGGEGEGSFRVQHSMWRRYAYLLIITQMDFVF